MASKRKKKLDRIQIFRRLLLAFFIILITILAFLHQKSVPGFGPIDALCPFGGIETIYMIIAKGVFISKTFSSNLILLAGVIFLGLLIGRYFCGWLCMLGGLMEFFALLGKKIFKRRFVIPPRIDKPLRYLKYVILVLILFFTWKTGELIIRPYDPFVAYAHLGAGLRSVWDEFAIGLIILVVTLFASMLYDRVFCKYLCPLGAFLGILNKIGIYRIRRESKTCINCSICDKSCPVNLNVSVQKAVKSAECINCLECVTDCPTKKNSLIPSFLRKEVKPIYIVLTGIIIYAGIIGASKLTGQWESADQSLQEMAEEGTLIPDDIKGSNTLQEVSDIFGLDLQNLYERLNLDMEIIPSNTRLKEVRYLIEGNSFETDEVRIVVKDMLGIIEMEGNIEHPASNDSQILNDNIEELGTSFYLEGTMTLNDVAEATGISIEEIINKLNLNGNIPQNQPLRDLKDQYGFTIPELRGRLNE